MRIYGHYVLIDGKDTSFYRHLIQSFDIVNRDDEDKWTAYKFTLRVYHDLRRIHHERIISAADQLPDPEVSVVQPLSQQSENLESSEQDDSQLTTSYSQQTESELPSSQTSEPMFKKPKGKGKK